MPIHPAVVAKFSLLEGASSLQEFFEDPAWADRRKAFDEQPGYLAPEVATRSGEVPGPHGPVPVRIYSPDSPAGAPALVWLHGGGFMAGHLDMPEADWVARELVSRAGIVVVGVDYRLCVGGVHYPVPHDDVVAAARWVRDQALSLGVDAGQISLGGASAGANLAAGAAVKLRDTDGWQPAQLILAYPVAHPVLPPPSASLTALAALEGLGSVLVLNAEYDDLRCSGEAFAAALALAGVDVRQVQVTSMLHGFLNTAASIEPTGAALDLIAGVVVAP